MTSFVFQLEKVSWAQSVNAETFFVFSNEPSCSRWLLSLNLGDAHMGAMFAKHRKSDWKPSSMLYYFRFLTKESHRLSSHNSLSLSRGTNILSKRRWLLRNWFSEKQWLILRKNYQKMMVKELIFRKALQWLKEKRGLGRIARSPGQSFIRGLRSVWVVCMLNILFHWCFKTSNCHQTAF